MFSYTAHRWRGPVSVGNVRNALPIDEMFQPAISRWVTGTMKRRPVHCYLYSNALVVVPTDKKVHWYPLKWQVSKLCLIVVYCGVGVYVAIATDVKVYY